MLNIIILLTNLSTVSFQAEQPAEGQPIVVASTRYVCPMCEGDKVLVVEATGEIVQCEECSGTGWVNYDPTHTDNEGLMGAVSDRLRDRRLIRWKDRQVVIDRRKWINDHRPLVQLQAWVGGIWSGITGWFSNTFHRIWQLCLVCGLIIIGLPCFIVFLLIVSIFKRHQTTIVVQQQPATIQPAQPVSTVK